MLSSENSTEPLQISMSSMLDLMGNLDISDDFINVLLAFGNKPRESETGIQRFSCHQIRENIFGKLQRHTLARTNGC